MAIKLFEINKDEATDIVWRAKSLVESSNGCGSAARSLHGSLYRSCRARSLTVSLVLGFATSLSSVLPSSLLTPSLNAYFQTLRCSASDSQVFELMSVNFMSRLPTTLKKRRAGWPDSLPYSTEYARLVDFYVDFLSCHDNGSLDDTLV
ncbi:hypothetical protein RRG08_059806 [Elysia crispata]|uniref:Uncharacterized protein n=1 Tax=Elysia crispata TaxID=231223 RepID=A0AAE1BD47_9GAST|nr:hypothetical protein RRG08_059806 [Elysia crispata]